MKLEIPEGATHYALRPDSPIQFVKVVSKESGHCVYKLSAYGSLWHLQSSHSEQKTLDEYLHCNGFIHVSYFKSTWPKGDFGSLETKTKSKYYRIIKGFELDVYDVLSAYNVECPARAHALKKLLMPGGRGHKDFEKDMREAILSIERSIQLEKGERNVY